MDIEPADNHMRETYISARRRLDHRWIIFLAVLKDMSVPGILETHYNYRVRSKISFTRDIAAYCGY